MERVGPTPVPGFSNPDRNPMNPSIPTSASRVSRFALGALCCSSLALPLSAVSLYWDASGDGADSAFGGNGTWSASDTNWNTSATNGSGALQAWTGGLADGAVFLRGTSGDVTVSGTIQAASMNFGLSTGSYTTGSGGTYNLTGGTLDLRQSSGGVLVQTLNGITANIGSGLSLFNGFVNTTASQSFRSTSGSMVLNGNLVDNSGQGAHTINLESFGGSITINGNITRTGTATVALQIGGGASSTQSNNGVYTLAGNNSGLVGTIITLNRGTLVINNGSATGSASGITVGNSNTTAAAPDTARVLVGTAGVTMTRNVTFNALTANDTNDVRAIGGQNTSGVAAYSGNITVNAMAASGAGSSVQFASESGGRVNFTGSIFGSGAITKVGDGIVALSRPNAGTTHSGGVTVSAGTLLANGFNSTGSGAVVVNSGATLGGNGTVAGAITLHSGARFSPGDIAANNSTSLAGTFTGSSSFTWNSNNTVGFDFDLGADQASSDRLALTGAFTKGTGSAFVFDFTDLGITPSFTYTLITFGSNAGFSVGDFVANGVAGSFGLDAGSLTFTTAAIPEPSAAAALAALAVLGLTGLRRRRG